MGNDHWNERSFRKGPGSNRYPAPRSGYSTDAPPRAPISWVVVIFGLLAWTVVVYVGYVALDIALSWLSTSGGAVLQAGKDAGSAIGVGKEVGVAIDSLKSTGLLDQAVSLLMIVLKPAAIVIWALGALLIVLLPRMLWRLGGAFGRRRH
ncbi:MULTISPECIES: hypothetical protein [Hyphomicrobiales]|uniref:Uncharacterized protein n=2 Tax=Hyphomicrobiales TaxID=356 RepID=A0A1H8X1K4_9BRAD|nr:MULTISPECIES: hypothetical protein [Hyphomicrobiales]GHE75271.1 hypothetical protein GCM10019059_38400 [Camelimonas fluminis]SEP33822.1 hypothetical protein SAMN05444123_11577 [Rhodopseudomonas pseudopalustris]